MSKQDYVVQVENLWHSYDGENYAMQDVSLSIESGEFLAIVGQNGSGKTTLAKHLNGLLKPTRGRVVINGIDTQTASTSELARMVGYCYQNPDHQISADTVHAEMEFGPKNMGLSKEETAERVEYALRMFDLQDYRDYYPFNLGKGQRQKLAVASVLAMQPMMLLVDEPTTGLDWKGAKAIMDLLKRLNDEGHTVAFVTHDIQIVAEYAQRIVVMGGSKIIADSKNESLRELLTNDDILRQGRIRPLQTTRVARKLTEQGISSDLILADELLESILKKIGG